MGYGGKTINTLRLWAAAAPDYFDFRGIQRRRFRRRAGRDPLRRIPHPGSLSGRFHQHGAGLALRTGVLSGRLLPGRSGAALPARHNTDWNAFAEKAAIQLNDTHPAMAVPELMRILLDEAHLGGTQAWDITSSTLAYTNHTLLPEALEKWPLAWFEMHAAAPSRDHLRDQSPPAGRRSQPLPRRRGPRPAGEPDRRGRPAARSAWPIWPSSARTAPTASPRFTPSCCARRRSRTWPKSFPSASTTRPTASRRGAGCCSANPALSRTITEAIGDGWITDLSQLSRLKPLADDNEFPGCLPQGQARCQVAVCRLAPLVSPGQTVDPDTIFDCQVKRIHEYKRQLLNALRIVVLYNRLRENPNLEMPPRTFFFAGKAAPAYHLAKLIIKFINNLAGTIDGDPAVRGRLKVVFLPDYCVSLAERLIPASDVSNQISTAGYEASGTSNMKFMMNGALTVGTRDGATIEMAEEAGEENFFLFGLTAEQVRQPRLVQPAVALRKRAGDARGAGPDLLRSLQPQRAGHLRSAAGTLLTQRRLSTCTWPT